MGFHNSTCTVQISKDIYRIRHVRRRRRKYWPLCPLLPQRCSHACVCARCARPRTHARTHPPTHPRTNCPTHPTYQLIHALPRAVLNPQGTEDGEGEVASACTRVADRKEEELGCPIFALSGGGGEGSGVRCRVRICGVRQRQRGGGCCKDGRGGRVRERGRGGGTGGGRRRWRGGERCDHSNP